MASKYDIAEDILEYLLTECSQHETKDDMLAEMKNVLGLLKDKKFKVLKQDLGIVK